MPQVVCLQCGNEFHAPPSAKRKYCGWPCYWESKKERIDRDCECCGKPFQTTQSEIDKAHSRNSEVRYCSRECWRTSTQGEGNPSWKGGDVELKCAYCQKTFFRSRASTIAQRTGLVYCTFDCRAKHLAEDPTISPNWKDGAAVKQYGIRKSWQYSQWRKAVFEKDNYTCQKCRKRGGRLHAHHLYEFSEYEELRFHIKNGHTLCKSCHVAIKGKEREYRISLGLPADNPPFQLALVNPWD